MFVIDNLVSASITGFENPTKQYLDKVLELDGILIHHPSSTALFPSPNGVYARGVAKGDWLVVNSSLAPSTSDLLLVTVNGVRGVAPHSYLMQTKGSVEDIDIVGVIQQSIHFYRGAPDIPEHESLADLSLHSTLIEKDYATILAKASGDSMHPFIHSRDLMIIERHLDYREGDVCVVAYNGDLVIKRVSKMGGTLSSDNPNFKTVTIKHGDRVSLEGVVDKVIRLHRSA